MKINIIGKHPIPQPGFEGVMSFYEAFWFSKFGHCVDLMVPFTSREKFDDLRKEIKFTDFNEFEKFGASFKTRPIFPNSITEADECDVLVWQSYTPSDWQQFYQPLKTRSKVVTKNYPKFVPNSSFRTDPSVVNQFKAFDLVAVALKEDFDLINSDKDFADQFNSNFCYVPRGADPVLLHPNSKTPYPTLALDCPVSVGDDLRSIEHYFPAIEILEKKYKDLRVLTFNRTYPQIRSERIAVSRFDQFYSDFLNPAWIYLTINYRYSPAHIRAKVQKDVEAWRYKAIYEVQNIEAQMAGGCLVGHGSNLIPELYIPNKTGFLFEDFNDVNVIVDLFSHIIDNYGEISQECRRFAVEKFLWEDCMRRWERAMLNLLSS